MKTDVHDDSYFQKFFQNDSQLQASDVIVLNTILGYLQSPNFELFLNQTFPGLFPEDDIVGLLQLMTSRKPGKPRTL